MTKLTRPPGVCCASRPPSTIPRTSRSFAPRKAATRRSWPGGRRQQGGVGLAEGGNKEELAWRKAATRRSWPGGRRQQGGVGLAEGGNKEELAWRKAATRRS